MKLVEPRLIQIGFGPNLAFFKGRDPFASVHCCGHRQPVENSQRGFQNLRGGLVKLDQMAAWGALSRRQGLPRGRAALLPRFKVARRLLAAPLLLRESRRVFWGW